MLIHWLLVLVPVTTDLLLEVFASDRSCDPSALLGCATEQEQLAERLVVVVGALVNATFGNAASLARPFSIALRPGSLFFVGDHLVRVRLCRSGAGLRLPVQLAN